MAWLAVLRRYLQQIDKNLSVEENLKFTFLNTSSALFEEPENLLKQEIREASTYNAILFAIASGASKLSEIANKVGEPNSTCSNYLTNLIRLGLVKKEPPTDKKNRGKNRSTVPKILFLGSGFALSLLTAHLLKKEQKRSFSNVSNHI